MKIPNADQAVVDLRKLTGYALNPEHTDGKHKAVIFETVLGLTAGYADLLRAVLLDAVRENDATILERDSYGQRYRVDFEMTGPNGATATIRSGWIIRDGEDFPRLATVFVL